METDTETRQWVIRLGELLNALLIAQDLLNHAVSFDDGGHEYMCQAMQARKAVFEYVYELLAEGEGDAVQP